MNCALIGLSCSVDALPGQQAGLVLLCSAGVVGRGTPCCCCCWLLAVWLRGPVRGSAAVIGVTHAGAQVGRQVRMDGCGHWEVGRRGQAWGEEGGL